MAEKQGEIPKSEYFRVKNDWWDALTAYRVPGEQMQILMYIIRKTYGWKRTEWAITITEFQKATGINRRSVFRALAALKDKNLIGVKKAAENHVSYSFNKYYKTWVGGVKKDTRCQKSGRGGVKKAAEGGVKKAAATPIIGNNNLKDSLNNNAFDIFWAKYPLKKGKKKAAEIWLKLHKKNELPPLEKIIFAIVNQTREREIRKNENQFCPEWKYPATWLNQECWADECDLETEMAKWIKQVSQD